MPRPISFKTLASSDLRWHLAGSVGLRPVTAIMSELRRIKTELVSLDELQRTRGRMRAG
jgi:hypothetical protein